MPKIIKKKPAKKKPVQEHEVKGAALHAIEKLKQRQKQVIIVVSAVAAVVILSAVFFFYSSSRSSQAYALEQEAYKYYHGEIADKTMPNQERWKKALELYKKSLDADETPTALFYAGNCYYNLGDYDNAIKEYERFIDTFSSDKGILPLVYQKLASAYFRTEQDDKALDTLSRFAGFDNGTFRDTALMIEAGYYERTGEKEKALEKYKMIIADFPDSPWTAEAFAKAAVDEKDKAAVSLEKTPDETEKAPAAPAKEDSQAKESDEKGDK